MKVMHKNILCIVISSIVLISSCANEPRYYIALGDSVSAGYGLTLPDESHTTIFFTLLKNEGYVDKYVNMAVDGFTTTTLLEFLENLDNDDLRSIRNARVITVNIGGNNILSPFLNYLPNLGVVSGTDNIRAGTGDLLSGALGIISVIRNITPDPDLISSGITDVISGVGDVLTGARSIITGSEEIISGSLDAIFTFAGLFSAELNARLDDAVQTFSDEFEKIITWLDNNAPRATIIANTVYNPIPQGIFILPLEISNAANAFVESINQTIIQKSKSRGFLVTDIHPHLSNQLNLMKFNLNPFARDLSFDIIHPNALGHELIAQLNFDTFMQR